VEARYFQIKELVDLLCHYDLYAQIAAWIGGGPPIPFMRLPKRSRRYDEPYSLREELE
jgi:hypothetical protein